jgi:hypothetical protein
MAAWTIVPRSDAALRIAGSIPEKSPPTPAAAMTRVTRGVSRRFLSGTGLCGGTGR